MGCDMGQGYHIARPATLPQLLDILRSEGAARNAA
jgi:EAL domain-containing protein (putative c-di-GMP-specific phosphodiesterase class I)